MEKNKARAAHHYSEYLEERNYCKGFLITL